MDAAWELGITTFDTADAYGGGQSETIDRQVDGESRCASADRDQDVQPDGRRTGSRARACTHRAADRVQPRPPGRRRRRSLSRARVRSGRPCRGDGRDLRGPDRAQVDQGLRRQQLQCGATREMLVSGKPAVVQNSYSLLARGDEDGARPAVRRVRNRVHAVRTTGRRLADREVQARRARAGGIADGDASRTLRASAQAGDVRLRSTGSPRSQNGEASTPRRLRSPGCLPSPESRPSWSGLAGRSTWSPHCAPSSTRCPQRTPHEVGALFA